MQAGSTDPGAGPIDLSSGHVLIRPPAPRAGAEPPAPRATRADGPAGPLSEPTDRPCRSADRPGHGATPRGGQA
ncbi:hypothetical protein [Streptomyces reniochalinae]|uniref:hypothetical protein n=1 Tax=Streptomyces reniochalinae TaxID=2250578 RepID=UPI001FE60E85